MFVHGRDSQQIVHLKLVLFSDFVVAKDFTANYWHYAPKKCSSPILGPSSDCALVGSTPHLQQQH
jgi:hypothetical protein